MKCPKCGYLGFEHVERCRNCGYDFSLTSPASLPPDLPLRTDPHAMNPLDDLSLVDAAMVRAPSVRMSDAGPDLDRVFGAREPAPSSSPALSGRRAELPLFGPPIPDDEPLITRPSPPRQPLAVRRATPDAPKARAEPPLRAPALDLAIDPDEVAPPRAPAPSPASRADRSRWSTRHGRADDAVGAESAELAGGGRIVLAEAIEDVTEEVRSNAYSGVPHGEFRRVAACS